MTDGGHPEATFGREPWFRRRPLWAVGVAIVLYAGVFVLRFADDGADEAVTTLYVLPIALLAFGFGRRAGAAAGIVGTALLVLWVLAEDVSLSPLGWAARVVPMLLLGVLVGHSTDRLRAAAELERQLLAVEMNQREAGEINDSIVQGLAVAKWALECGSYDRSLEVLTQTMKTSQALVTDLLGSKPTRPGAFRRRSPVTRVGN